MATGLVHYGILASVIGFAFVKAQSQHTSQVTPSPIYRPTQSTPVCNGVLAGMSGVITSPGYPNNYSSNTNCEWELTVGLSKVILIKFKDLDIEEDSTCGYDKLTVQEKSGKKFKTTATYCGSKIPAHFRTRSNVIKIVFTSDESENRKGFMLEWTTIANQLDCGVTTFNSTLGTLQSPGFPNPYENSINCTYSIQVLQGYHIVITIKEIDIEYSTGCEYDMLRIDEVRNSGNAVLGKFCGVKPPSTDISSTTNHVLITFTSDESTNGKGFNVTWTSKRPSTENGRRRCGRKYHYSTRIVGGTLASPGEFPWQAGIFWQTGVAKGKYFCGGALIKENWVLTAAHCFVNGRNASFYQIKLGDQNLRKGDGHEQVFNISTIIVHPLYNMVTYDNDVALVKTETDANLTDFVNAICLPGNESSPGVRCMIAGWGATMEHGRASEDLIKAELPIVERRTCSRPDVYGSKITSNMICAGYANGGIDTCQGDSGGPLHCQSKDDPTVWEVQGIASWGRGCGRELRYGVYTKVYNFVQWIRCIVQKNEAMLMPQRATDETMFCSENLTVVNATRGLTTEFTTRYEVKPRESIDVTVSKSGNSLKSGLFLTSTPPISHPKGKSTIDSPTYFTSSIEASSAISTTTGFQTHTYDTTMSNGARLSRINISNDATKHTVAIQNSENGLATKIATMSKQRLQLAVTSIIVRNTKESLVKIIRTPLSLMFGSSRNISPPVETDRSDLLIKSTLVESGRNLSTTMTPYLSLSGIIEQIHESDSIASGSFVPGSMLVGKNHTGNFSIFHTESQNSTLTLALHSTVNNSFRAESSVDLERNENTRKTMPNAKSKGDIHCPFTLFLLALLVSGYLIPFLSTSSWPVELLLS